MQQSKKIPNDIRDMPLEQKDHLLDASRQALEMIYDIGSDYDGEQSVEGLRDLVDTLVEFAVKGLQGIRIRYVNGKDAPIEQMFGEWKKVSKDLVKK